MGFGTGALVVLLVAMVLAYRGWMRVLSLRETRETNAHYLLTERQQQVSGEFEVLVCKKCKGAGREEDDSSRCYSCGGMGHVLQRETSDSCSEHSRLLHSRKAGE